MTFTLVYRYQHYGGSYQTTRRHTLNDYITCGFHIARVTVLYWTHPWASSIPFSRTFPNTNTGRFSGKTLSLPQLQPANNYNNWYSVVTLRRLHL